MNIPSFSSYYKVAPNGISQIIELDLKEFPNPWSQSLWSSLKWEQYYTLCVIDDGHVCGYALWQMLELEEIAHLQKIIVRKRYRGQGMGQKLLENSINAMGSKLIKRLFLEVSDQNIKALALYGKMGFVMLNKVKSFYTNGDDALRLALEI